MTNLQQENWIPVPGYEQFYAVSNLGRVKALPRLRSEGRHWLKGKILNGSTAAGYMSVALRGGDGKVKFEYAHRLIAEAFIQNPNGSKQVNHIDGDKKNNAVTNLEWVTPSANLVHAYELGLNSGRGQKSNMAKLTDNQAVEIFEMGGKPKDIAAIYGVCDSTVRLIKKRKIWKHLTATL